MDIKEAGTGSVSAAKDHILEMGWPASWPYDTVCMPERLGLQLVACTL